MQLDKKTMIGIILGMVVLFSLLIGGFWVFILLGLFFLPSYLLLGLLDLDALERTLFALFLGIGILPIPIYWLGTVMSFRGSVALTFFLTLGIALGVRTYVKARKEKTVAKDLI